MQIFERLASTNWPALVTSVGAVLALLGRFRSYPRSRTGLKELVSIYDSLPDEAQGDLLPAIKRLSKDYAKDAQWLATRKINGPNLAALVLIAAIGVAGLWGLSWAAQTLSWLFWPAFGAWGAILIAFLAVGWQQFYKEPGGEEDS